MTKKHFVRMAEDFRDMLEMTDDPKILEGMRRAIETFMSVAASQNSRFSYSTFKDACGWHDKFK